MDNKSERDYVGLCSIPQLESVFGGTTVFRKSISGHVTHDEICTLQEPVIIKHGSEATDDSSDR